MPFTCDTQAVGCVKSGGKFACDTDNGTCIKRPTSVCRSTCLVWILVVAAVGFVVAGFLLHFPTHRDVVWGTVTNVPHCTRDCAPTDCWACTLDIQYTVQGTRYTQTGVASQSIHYAKGSAVQVWYSVSDPGSRVQLTTPSVTGSFFTNTVPIGKVRVRVPFICACGLVLMILGFCIFAGIPLKPKPEGCCTQANNRLGNVAFLAELSSSKQPILTPTHVV